MLDEFASDIKTVSLSVNTVAKKISTLLEEQFPQIYAELNTGSRNYGVYIIPTDKFYIRGVSEYQSFIPIDNIVGIELLRSSAVFNLFVKADSAITLHIMLIQK